MKKVFPIEDVWNTVKQKLRGHYLYYGIGGNYRKIAGYYFSVIRLVFKWLNRRSQRKSYNWQGFIKYLTKYPLPKPKLYHAYGK